MRVNATTAAQIVPAIRGIYNDHADEYALATERMDQFPGLDLDLDRFAGSLTHGPVLDLGCGTGRDTDYLTRKGVGVIAGDLSERLLMRTSSRCSPAGVVQLDLLNLPFADAAFAGVWACASVLHVPSLDHPRSFAEIHRVLRPGGFTAISLKAGTGEGWEAGKRLACPRWFSLRTPDSVVTELEAAGFAFADVVHSPRSTWFIAEAFKR